MTRTIILMAALGLVAGCQSEETVSTRTSAVETSSESSEAAPQPITEPTELVVSETSQPSLLESAELRIAGREPGGVEDVRAGDDLELVVRVTDVPEGLAAWVHWLGPDGEVLSEEQKEVPEGRTVAFRTPTEGWAAGEYSAEIFVGGDLVDIKSFRLTTE